MGEQKNQKTQDVNQLLKIRRDKLADLQADGKDTFKITKFDVTHHSQEVKDQFEDLEGKSVVLAGRMMSKRVMGKASFCNIQDLQGNIQSYVARDSIGEEENEWWSTRRGQYGRPPVRHTPPQTASRPHR